MKKVILFLFAITALASCTQNQRAKNFGGTATYNLPTGERFVNATWKENNLWIVTKRDTAKPITYTMTEQSNFGVMQGKVVIIEH